eukprot:12671115-Alexandrium_andersonii.AAC.1
MGHRPPHRSMDVEGWLSFPDYVVDGHGILCRILMRLSALDAWAVVDRPLCRLIVGGGYGPSPAS